MPPRRHRRPRRMTRRGSGSRRSTRCGSYSPSASPSCFWSRNLSLRARLKAAGKQPPPGLTDSSARAPGDAGFDADRHQHQGPGRRLRLREPAAGRPVRRRGRRPDRPQGRRLPRHRECGADRRHGPPGVRIRRGGDRRGRRVRAAERPPAPVAEQDSAARRNRRRHPDRHVGDRHLGAQAGPAGDRDAGPVPGREPETR